jgi:hypothetical protein
MGRLIGPQHAHLQQGVDRLLAQFDVIHAPNETYRHT